LKSPVNWPKWQTHRFSSRHVAEPEG